MPELILLAGLAGFLGLHSIAIVAHEWRTAQIAKLGEKPWKAMYALVSLISFGLIVWAYGESRLAPTVLWTPPIWTRHLAALLTLPAFLLLVAAFVPGNRIKSAVGHPMVAGTKVWALAHLLANGNLADVLLFGSFLAWAIADFISARKRDKAVGRSYPSGPMSRTVITVVIGLIAWGVFSRYLHLALIGVAPFHSG